MSAILSQNSFCSHIPFSIYFFLLPLLLLLLLPLLLFRNLLNAEMDFSFY